MLSRAQEARVRDLLTNHAPGIVRTYCLEHLAAHAQIPDSLLGALAAYVRNLRARGACHTQYGGVCNAEEHQTTRVLIWG